MARPNPLGGHGFRIAKSQETAADQSGVEKIATGPAEHFLADHHGHGAADSHHPQRYRRRQGQRQNQTGNQKTFVYLFSANHREPDFYQTAHCVCDNNHGDDPQAEKIHPHEQRRQQSHNHHRHVTFHIQRIPNMRRLRSPLRA